MKTLIELYSSVLNSVGMVADAEGYISTRLPGSDKSKPAMIDSKRQVLPTPNQLAEPDWSGRIGFHPLLQKVEEGESRAVDKLRDRMNVYADFMTGVLFLNIASLACEEEKHKELKPNQAAWLGPFSDADEKFQKLIVNIVGTSRLEKKNFEFVRFSLLRGRVVDGRKRSRVAVLHFPLYEVLKKNGTSEPLLGHKLRGKDVKMLVSMYEHMFPNIDDKGNWEIASDSLIAASMECLMGLYAKYVNIHNGVVVVLGESIDSSNDLLIVNDWEEEMKQLPHYRSQIQSIPWLEGVRPAAAKVASEPQSISANPARPAVAPPPPVHKPSFVIEPPVVTTNTGPQITTEQANKVSTVFNTTAPRVHQIGQPYVDPNIAIQQQAQQQAQQQQLLIQQQQLQQQAQAQKIPESARLINGQLYMPVESNGVSQIPPGALLVESRLYVPLQQQQQPLNQQQLYQQQLQQQQMGMQPGMIPQQQLTPNQMPNLSPQEVAYYNANPIAFQNYMAQLQQGAAMQVAQQQQQRQAAIPRYLRNALTQQAQQQQMEQQLQQQQFGFGAGFFNR